MDEPDFAKRMDRAIRNVISDLVITNTELKVRLEAATSQLEDQLKSVKDENKAASD